MPDPLNPGLFFRDTDGNRHYIDQDAAAEAQAAGMVLEPGQTATYTDPEGRVSTVKAEDYLTVITPFQEQEARLAPGAVARGITDEAAIEEEFSGLGGAAIAGGAGLARGATAGLSDLLLTKTGIADESTLREARQARPGLSTGSELVGAIAPALASGGSGLLGAASRKTIAGQVAKQGSKLSTRLGGGIKGAAAGEALEGAIYGAGQGVSNLVLRDEPITAEAAVAEVGLGALIGGAAGAGLGAAGGALGKVSDKVKNFATKKSIVEPLSEEGKALATKVNRATADIDDASKAIFGDLENAASKTATETFDSAVARNYDTAMTRHFDEVEKHIQNIESGLYTKFDEVAEAVPSGPHGTKVIDRKAQRATDATAVQKPRRADATVAGGGGKRVPVDVGPQGSVMKKSRELLDQARKTREEFVEFAGRKGALTESGTVKWDDLRGLQGGDLQKAKKLFKKYQDDVRKMADEAGVNLADEDKFGNVLPGGRGLFDLLADVPITKKTAAAPVEGAAEALKSAKDAQKRFRSAFGAKADEPVDFARIIDQEPAKALESIKAFEDYSRGLREAASVVDGGATGSIERLARAEREIADLVQDSVGKDGKLPELAEIAVVFGIEQAVLPDMGPASDLLKLYAAYRMVKAVHGGKSAIMGGAKGGKVKRFAKGLTQAVSGRVATDTIATPLGAAKAHAARTVAGNVFDSIMGGTGKLARSADNAVFRVQEGMSKSLSKAQKGLRRAGPVTTTVLNGVSFAGEDPGPKKSAQEAFKTRSAEISAQVANLPGLQKRVHDSLASVRQANMGVGDKMAAHAVASVQFLYDKMPKDPGTLQQFGVSKWRPSEAELDKWARYINAVQDPAGIIERFADGKMSREDAETMRVLYPGHYAQVQDWIMSNLPEMQEKMSYAKRIQLSSLMGVPADPIVARTGTWQESFMQPEPVAPQQQAEIENNNQPTAAQMMQGVRE